MPTKKPTCCGQETKTGKRAGVFIVMCTKCGKRAEGKSPEEAINKFLKMPKQNSAKQNRQLTILPANAAQLPAYVADNYSDIMAVTAPYVQSNKSAFDRLVKNNIKYVMQNKDKRFLECWNTPEGQQSIIDAMDEAFSLGAELGKMGSIVPFSGVAEFIPGVEAYEFALTNGKTAPFKTIKIDPIHANDQYETGEDENENFFFRFQKQSIPRGKVIAVVVRAIDRDGDKIGRIYDAERLLEKAKTHSPSYRAYRRDLDAYAHAVTENRDGKDENGRKYFDKIIGGGKTDQYFEQDVAKFKAAEKAGKLKKDKKGDYAVNEIPKKDGTTWEKKIYRSQIENPGQETKRIYLDELSNPYDGPDQAEMLIKTAGKSFFARYVKVRNAIAAMDELSEDAGKGDDIDGVIDSALDKAFGQFDAGHDLKPDGIDDADFQVMDAEEDEQPEEEEPEEEEEEQPEEKPAEKQKPKIKEEDIF